MTPERAQELVSLTTVGGDTPLAYRPKWKCSTYQPHPRGVTIEENAYIGRVWETMPGYTCYRDALLRIARGEHMNVKSYDWHTMPQDQGRIVEVSYASDGEGERYLRRTFDRSDRSQSLEELPYRQATGDFEPWNGIAPHGPWRQLPTDHAS